MPGKNHPTGRDQIKFLFLGEVASVSRVIRFGADGIFQSSFCVCVKSQFRDAEEDECRKDNQMRINAGCLDGRALSLFQKSLCVED